MLNMMAAHKIRKDEYDARSDFAELAMLKLRAGADGYKAALDMAEASGASARVREILKATVAAATTGVAGLPGYGPMAESSLHSDKLCERKQQDEKR